jgi:predicted DNA-binding transcriptional regulator AlpA
VNLAFEKRFLTIRETATLLSMNPKSVYRSIDSGALPCVRIPSSGKKRFPIRIDRLALFKIMGVKE